jgi:hypothetical protein
MGNQWRFPNGTWQSMSWAGNQYGLRSDAVKAARAANSIGAALFVVGAFVSLTNADVEFSKGDMGAASKSLLDVVMGAIGQFGGVAGFATATGYGAVNIMAEISGGWTQLGLAIAAPPVWGSNSPIPMY